MATQPAIGSSGLQSVLKALLSKDDLRFARNGFKLKDYGSDGQLDLTKGRWEKPAALGKPQRWLFHLMVDAAGSLTAVPSYPNRHNVGLLSNTKGDCAAIFFKILPMLEESAGAYVASDDLEVHALILFDGPLPVGTGSEPISFDPSTGEVSFKGAPVSYVFGALFGIRPPGDVIKVGSTATPIRYGDVVQAISLATPYAPSNGASGHFPTFDLTDEKSFLAARQDIAAAWASVTKTRSALKIPPGPVTTPITPEDEQTEKPQLPAILSIPVHPELLGIDEAVYRQINGAITTGKRHLVFHGPPGTGKTTLAQWVASHLVENADVQMITGSADWSSQDIVGGYQTLGEGKIGFIKGVLLRNFDRPIVIDELNRAEIDKAIGPLFSVLSGQPVSLPHRTDVAHTESAQYRILAEPKAVTEPHEFAPGDAWRIIATMNNIDRGALRSFSFALSRRFAWIRVDAPKDTAAFIEQYLVQKVPGWQRPQGQECPLAKLWREINRIRPLGAAPFLDIMKIVLASHGPDSFWGAPSDDVKQAVIDGIEMYLLPMLDGIDTDQMSDVLTVLEKDLGFNAEQVLSIRRALFDEDS